MELARLEPARVSRVVLLAPWVDPASDPPGLLVRVAWAIGPRASFALLSLPGVKRGLVEWNLRRAWHPRPVPAEVRERAARRWQDSPAKVVAFLRENVELAALLPQLALRRHEITVPVTILFGEDDRTLDARRHAEGLARDLPRGDLVPLAETGHMIAQTRPEAVLAAITGEPDLTADDLVGRFGWNPISAQAAGEGFLRWIRDDGFVAYVTRGRHRIAAGPPVGPEERLGALARAFETESLARGKRVVWFGATERLRAQLPGHGRVGIGATPWFDPRGWRPSRSVRELARRAAQKGVDISEGAGHEEARRVRDAWLRARAIAPLGFLTRFPALDGSRRLFAARVEGRLVAFAVLAPVRLRNGWLIEAIARDGDAPPGVSEALVVFVASTLASEGSTYLTLGLAPLASVGLGEGRSWPERLLRLARREAGPLYDFAGLEAFKAKFRPVNGWEPAYLIAATRITFGDLFAVYRAFTDESPRALASRWWRARRVR